MSARAGLALIVLALLGLGLAPLSATAQERERRCYFGECPSEDSPQPPPPEYTPPPDAPVAGSRRPQKYEPPDPCAALLRTVTVFSARSRPCRSE